MKKKKKEAKVLIKEIRKQKNITFQKKYKIMIITSQIL